MWVRRDAAFDAVVGAPDFAAAQAIIQERYKRASDVVELGLPVPFRQSRQSLSAGPGPLLHRAQSQSPVNTGAFKAKPRKLTRGAPVNCTPTIGWWWRPNVLPIRSAAPTKFSGRPKRLNSFSG